MRLICVLSLKRSQTRRTFLPGDWHPSSKLCSTCHNKCKGAASTVLVRLSMSAHKRSLATDRRTSNEPPPKKRRTATEKPASGADVSAVTSPLEPQPSNESTRHVIDTFFAKCENQPYSLFHEGHFRQRFEAANIPGHLILAMMAVALRFSSSQFTSKAQDLTITYANQSWKSVVSECLLTHRSLDVDLVQTLSLLSLFDFTGMRGITSC